MWREVPPSPSPPLLASCSTPYKNLSSGQTQGEKGSLGEIQAPGLTTLGLVGSQCHSPSVCLPPHPHPIRAECFCILFCKGREGQSCGQNKTPVSFSRLPGPSLTLGGPETCIPTKAASGGLCLAGVCV